MAHVVSCRFLRLGCSEEEHPLFKREYARSNQGRGVKLLRCFPHCCPGHIERNYCGCSIHLLVTFSDDVSSAELDELLVCTRFEPSHAASLLASSLVSLIRDAGAVGDEDKPRHENDRSLQIGESVTLSGNLFTEQANEDSVWLRAQREMQHDLPKNATLYAINNHTHPKWLYSYDSGTIRGQREMTHHLVAYMFQLPGHYARMQQPGGSFNAVVLARYASPAFSLVSFRRSGSASVDLSESGISSDNVKSDAFPAEQQHTDADFPFVDNNNSNIDSRQREAYDFHEKGLHLLILWKFFTCLKLGDIEFRTNRVGLYVRSFLMRAAAFRDTSTTSYTDLENVAVSALNDALGHAFNPPTRIPTAANVDARIYSDQESAVIRATVHFFMRVVSSAAVLRLVNSVVVVARSTMSKTVLHEQFMTLVSGLYDAFDSLVRELPYDAPFGNQDVSLPILVDDVLSVLYGRESFDKLRLEISALLEWKKEPELLSKSLNEVFQVFAAQVREATISFSTQDRHIMQQQSTTATNRAFRHRWLLMPESMQILDITSGRSCKSFDDFRVVDIVQFMCEFSCVDILTDNSDCCLSFRSVFPVYSDTTRAPTTLILDGKLRIFRVLPSGISSMVATAGGWSVGDYAGALSSDCHSFVVDLFGFAEGHHPSSGNKVVVARHVKLTITLKQEQIKTELLRADSLRDSALLVHAVVHGSAYRPPRNNPISLAKISTADRAALWSKLKWTPMSEMQAEYRGV
ncbi:hypothetical protein PC129_g18962 [Phytophthora cactorum]|uniref:Uncharacterized protein n=2 Tax=Phytophthora cactorum TaxID=29920 RepID=A0A329RJZ6_9STRA|nr:hypothetical protein Pcac1_g19043 [Phytophthora cactorum]KAG2821498.1 hypothetical protein PC112_g11355 [Phytophthora cactorum]KAG2856052.1 hypothetical protein PC113_g11919 [Phytophthora cactorum]KAG2880763.1 hypothetical protein PC114_g21904 [Phytophthora cactorum]KAG2901446.1 hypothetical protein PC117_g21739 [Phytophthora cactorum]